MFAVLPTLKSEFLKYPAVYRTQEGIKSVMPVGMVAMFVGILALAVLYAMTYLGGSSITSGAQFGALIGVFAVLRFCGAQLREFEYWRDAYGAASRRLPH